MQQLTDLSSSAWVGPSSIVKSFVILITDQALGTAPSAACRRRPGRGGITHARNSRRANRSATEPCDGARSKGCHLRALSSTWITATRAVWLNGSAGLRGGLNT
jgi:hypothetical protein